MLTSGVGKIQKNRGENMIVSIGSGLILPNQRAILRRARETYGNKTQVAVSAEECAELTKELLKYLRFDDHETAVSKTRENVISETVDVLIILDHIANIFNITPQELVRGIDTKLNRLKVWLDNSDSIEYTTKLRELKEQKE